MKEKNKEKRPKLYSSHRRVFNAVHACAMTTIKDIEAKYKKIDQLKEEIEKSLTWLKEVEQVRMIVAKWCDSLTLSYDDDINHDDLLAKIKLEEMELLKRGD